MLARTLTKTFGDANSDHSLHPDELHLPGELHLPPTRTDGRFGSPERSRVPGVGDRPVVESRGGGLLSYTPPCPGSRSGPVLRSEFTGYDRNPLSSPGVFNSCVPCTWGLVPYALGSPCGLRQWYPGLFYWYPGSFYCVRGPFGLRPRRRYERGGHHPSRGTPEPCSRLSLFPFLH